MDHLHINKLSFRLVYQKQAVYNRLVMIKEESEKRKVSEVLMRVPVGYAKSANMSGHRSGTKFSGVHTSKVAGLPSVRLVLVVCTL